jgi:PAS domain S-box-containing protein
MSNEPGAEWWKDSESFRVLVEAGCRSAVCLLDPNGRVVRWNPGTERLLGYPAEEALGLPIATFYPPEDVVRLVPQKDLESAAASGHWQGSGWRVRKDGSRFWADVLLLSRQGPQAKPPGFALVLHDASERRRAEAHIEAGQRKDEFLVLLAHELRNPLAPILTCLHILDQPGADAHIQAQARQTMTRQVRHLVLLVDDLLDALRIARGAVQLRRERLDLGRLVRTTAEGRRPQLERAGLALTVEAPETPVWVHGDRGRLAQVLTTLLEHAVRRAEREGLLAVRLLVDLPRQQALLSVRDTGAGIEPEVLARLWDVSGQAARFRNGLALGLAVVKGLVELHGGEVHAASAGGEQGAVFTVRLPLEAEPAALAPAPEAPPAGAVRLRVLVIEDNKDAAASLRMLLEVLGHETRVTYTGREGVAAALAWRPDVVISDIGLPGLDGYEVARELRLHPTTARVRLVALTGYGGDDDRRRSRQAGFDHHLTKPAEPQALLELLTPAR